MHYVGTVLGSSALHRRAFLATSLTAGVGLAAPSRALASTDEELAYANFGSVAELLLAEYYRRAVATGLFRGSALGALRRAGFDEREHYAALELVLTGAGEAPPIAEDLELAIPAVDFCTRSIA